jgi:hypothetical protein
MIIEWCLELLNLGSGSGFPSNATLFEYLFSILFSFRYMFRSYDHLQAEI